MINRDIIFCHKVVDVGFVRKESVEKRANVDFFAIIRQKQRVLQSGIGVADERDLFVLVKRSVAQRAIRHAVTDKFVFAGDADMSCACAGCDDDGFPFVRAVVGKNGEDVAVLFKSGDLFQLEIRAVVHNLFKQSVGEFRPRDCGNRGEVFDARRKRNLTADGFFFQHKDCFAVS